ncbi:hypothetical protein G0Q06_02710 [Puniceicoccales bacterium CK1056]|uniref:Alginate lyase domain-containing protein n=1 Tax=Oceanipulchritudo coccoides TaxID=2706888 RepID=A0A6B2LXN2_9BACT|nr:chondroitinase-B domain-containing protein [Oceanipulchritudo coccoides]NDV61358.1 hypothetical protein [Oceanipulchritudo coccoides]
MITLRILFLVTSLNLLTAGNGADIQLVRTPAELTATLGSLEAGDILQLDSGVWDSLELTLDVSGTPDAPIVLKGAEDGSTIITGRSSIEIGGSHITVSDLRFEGVEPPEGAEAIVSFRDSEKSMAYGSRLSNCIFDSCNPDDPERRYAWVRLYGQENRVDHNLFSNQKHSGVTVQVRMKLADARHRIDHNHFLDREQGDGNGFECIQIGQSQDSEKAGNCLVDSNLFERCDGETEIISSKTDSNTFRSNVFLESSGSLTLRHGDKCLVEENIFIGKGKHRTGGVRVIGSGHTVRNNYFEGLSGLTGGVIVLYSGIPGSPLNGYFAADRATIKNNLIVDCGGIGLYLNGGYGERGRSILPSGVTITGNLIDLGKNGSAQIVGSLPDVEFSDNVLSSGNEAGRSDFQGLEKMRLTIPRDTHGLLQPNNEAGKPVFAWNGDNPRLLKRSEVGPSWHVALPVLGALNADQVGRLIRGDFNEGDGLVEAVINKASLILKEQRSYTVTSNERIPPSGDIRSYYSTGPYWWRNPDTADGLPYVRRDGEFNPERDIVSDRPALHAMVDDVWNLVIAYLATGEEPYALYAQKLLRIWFLDTKTGMLPDLNHAQAIPGVTDGRGTGIIDTLVFVELVDAIKLLELSCTGTLSGQTQIREWFGTFLEWLSYHPNGIAERNAKNNHGTAYDLQQLAIAHFLGKSNLSANILKRVKEKRIPNQITMEGLQPLELQRSRSWSYCTENLEHFARIAAIGRNYGENLFAYKSAEGASLLTAFDFLASHACDPAVSWPHEQVTEWQTEYLYATTSILSGFFQDSRYDRILECIPAPHDALLSKLMK